MTALIAFAALALTLYYIYLLSLHVDLGLLSLLATELYITTLGIEANVVAGFHVTPVDLVYFCLFVAGVIRTAQTMKHLNITRFLALGYSALITLSVVRGVSDHGMAASLNEVRGFQGPLFCMLYFLTTPTDEKSLRRYTKIYLCFGAALCVVAALAAAGLPVGVVATSGSEEVASDGRYLGANAVAAIAVCGFLSLALLRYRQRGLKSQFLLVMYLFIAVILRHRTVWMMLLAGIVMLLPLDGKMFRRVLPFALAAGFMVCGLVIFGGSGPGGNTRADQFSESATNSDTLGWRVGGWIALIFDDEENALNVTIGKSMGTGFERIDPETHRIITAGPHSEYVFEYLRVGAVGALLLVFFALRPLVMFWKLTKVDAMMVYPSTSAWVVVIGMTLVCGFTYGFGLDLYALLGIANAVAVNEGKAENYVRQTDWECDANTRSSSHESA